MNIVMNYRAYSITFLLFIVFFLLPLSALTSTVRAIGGNILISEIQIEGVTTFDEFVELYNPSSSPVVLTDWTLTRKTSGGAESNLVLAFDEATIPALGYFLVANEAYTGSIVADQIYSANSQNIAPSNTVLLYDADGILVDKVGMGEAIDFETEVMDPPLVNESIERKANADSTIESMVSGSDQFVGNGQETDNNSLDFVLRGASNPQNVSSSIEPEQTETASPTPTVEPTESPSSSPTP